MNRFDPISDIYLPTTIFCIIPLHNDQDYKIFSIAVKCVKVKVNLLVPVDLHIRCNFNV